jgi:hypothetical protein
VKSVSTNPLGSLSTTETALTAHLVIPEGGGQIAEGRIPKKK